MPKAWRLLTFGQNEAKCYAYVLGVCERQWLARSNRKTHSSTNVHQGARACTHVNRHTHAARPQTFARPSCAPTESKDSEKGGQVGPGAARAALLFEAGQILRRALGAIGEGHVNSGVGCGDFANVDRFVPVSISISFRFGAFFELCRLLNPKRQGLGTLEPLPKFSSSHSEGVCQINKREARLGVKLRPLCLRACSSCCSTAWAYRL